MGVRDIFRVVLVFICELSLMQCDGYSQELVDTEKLAPFHKQNGKSIPFSPGHAIEMTITKSEREEERQKSLVEVKLRGFIPSPIVALGPEFYSPRTLDLSKSNPLVVVFSGDDRSFSYDQGTARVNVVAVVGLTDGMVPQHPAERDNRWGTTHGYDSFDCQHVRGKPFWWWEKRTRGPHQFDPKHFCLQQIIL